MCADYKGAIVLLGIAIVISIISIVCKWDQPKNKENKWN